jgi:hypothetical protein
MTLDLKAAQESYAYDDGILPPIEFAFAVLCDAAGTCGGADTVPAGNPIPWSGVMFDNIKLDVVSCGATEVVDTQYTGSLAPGAEENIILCWDDAELCNWCLCGDIQLATDIDPSNDVCCVDGGIAVRETYGLEGFSALDLTSGIDDECLWHICCTRNCDGTCCAWAGIEEEHHGHYVNNMDDSLVSPVVDLSDYGTGMGLGVSLDITTWFDFADGGDFGEVYVRNSSSGDWVLLRDYSHDMKTRLLDSSGGFDVYRYYITPEHCTETTQFRFRMVSDDEGYGEGWYICNVDLVEVLDAGSPPAPGDTWYAYGAGYTWDYPGPGAFDSADASTYYNIAASTLTTYGGCWYDGGWLILTDTGDLYDVDADTGVETYRSSTTLTGTPTISGLCVHQGTLYASTVEDLYIVDPDTGATTLVGSFGTTTGMIGMASDDTNIYGISIDPDSSYIINAGTGAATEIGPTGYATGYAQDTACDKATGEIYHAAYISGGECYLTHLNKVTGALELMSTFPLVEIVAFAIPSISGDVPIAWGNTVWSDDFDRLTIAPWTCIEIPAGNHWDTNDQRISNYPAGLNNAMYTLLDFTVPEEYDLAYVELYFETAWDLEDGCHAYIEISLDWDGVSPMSSATWVPFWEQEGASTQGWISSWDLVEDDRFVLNEYIGEKIYLRFRLTTPSDGFKYNDGYWVIHNKQIIFKLLDDPFVDEEPPVTNICFDSNTGKVTLFAQDYPLVKGKGVKATYYRIGSSGNFNTYTQPFAMPEGTNTVYYYSEDNEIPTNKEATKSATYTVDTTPPTVTIISPEEGKFYLFGSPIFNRLFNNTNTLCIGKVPIEATADDAGGSGIAKVLFAFANGTSWDDEAPYTSVYKGRHFGDLTITVTALDKVGLESDPAEITVKVYSLGLF